MSCVMCSHFCTLCQVCSRAEANIFILQILLNIRNDIDHVYYFKDNILYEINSLGTNKINENNTIYKFFANNFEDGIISDWLYDSDSNKYLKIVPIKFENYSVGISYKVDDTSVLYKNIINMFSDIKVSLNSDDKVLYERVNDSEFNKALSKDNELFTYTDEEGKFKVLAYVIPPFYVDLYDTLSQVAAGADFHVQLVLMMETDIRQKIKTGNFQNQLQFLETVVNLILQRG